MMASGAPSGGGASASFGNTKYDALYKMVSGCDREEGMSRDELAGQLGGNQYYYFTKHISLSMRKLSV